MNTIKALVLLLAILIIGPGMAQNDPNYRDKTFPIIFNAFQPTQVDRQDLNPVLDKLAQEQGAVCVNYVYLSNDHAKFSFGIVLWDLFNTLGWRLTPWKVDDTGLISYLASPPQGGTLQVAYQDGTLMMCALAQTPKTKS